MQDKRYKDALGVLFGRKEGIKSSDNLRLDSFEKKSLSNDIADTTQEAAVITHAIVVLRPILLSNSMPASGWWPFQISNTSFSSEISG